MKVTFYDTIEDNKIKFAVICAIYQEQILYVKHKARTTLEIPGGHREHNETIDACAHRELYEETGATSYTLLPVSVYSVTGKTRVNETGEESFGMLYVAKVDQIGQLPDSEIECIFLSSKEISNYTYPEIQPQLLEEVKKRGYLSFL